MPATSSQAAIAFILNIALWLIPMLLAITALKLLLSAKLKGAAGERAVEKVLDGLGEQTWHDPSNGDAPRQSTTSGPSRAGLSPPG